MSLRFRRQSHACVCMLVALYLRVSAEEQRERHSIATQQEFAERYYALHYLQVSAVYTQVLVTESS